MYFSKKLIANQGMTGELNANRQWDEVRARRAYFNNMEKQHAQMQGLNVNAAAVIPQDVYREFDNVTKKIMRNDEGDVILNDLLPLARSVHIGKIEYQFRRASDSGNAKTSISGQGVVTMDKAQYSYDKAIIPIHQDGFGRQWREYAGQQSEGFDALIDDQENSTRALRRKMVGYIMDGDAGVVFNGTSWSGIRNDTRVASETPAVDLTSITTSSEQFRNEFKRLRDVLRITNNASTVPLTVYVSREIMSNGERYYSDNEAGFRTQIDSVRALSGIAEVKETAELTGNQVMMIALSNEFIRPLVGMGVNTTAIPRMNPFDNHNFLTWGAMGLQVVTDYDGRTGVLYAA